MHRPSPGPRSLAAAFAALLSLLSLAAPPAGAAVITVDSASDLRADDGVCTFREALRAANQDAASGATPGECAAGSGPDVIEFAIPGAGPHVLVPETGYDFVTKPLVIDATSQPGTVCGEDLQVEIDGSVLTDAGSPAAAVLFFPGSAGSALRGLAIHGFALSNGGRAVKVLDHDVTVECNFFGLHGDGSPAAANRYDVSVASVEGLRIAGNVFVGAGVAGVDVADATAGHIAGNRFGVGPDGDVIGGNGGIFGPHSTSCPGPLVIGSDMDGVDDAAEANWIAGHTFNGISIAGNCALVTIRRNRIHDNLAAGIRLGSGTTQAVPDADGVVNTPEVLAAEVDVATRALRVTVTTSSDPADVAFPLALDLYRADGDGEEGEAYVATVEYRAEDAVAGQRVVEVRLAADAALAPGDRLVATATSADGDTSMFSVGTLVDAGTVTIPPPPSLPPFFADGFETGDLAAWSAQVGG